MNKVLIILLFTSLCSCSPGLNITFENDCREDLKRLEATIGTKIYVFENLKDSATTQPIIVPGSFRFFPLIIITDIDTFAMPGQDSLPGKFYKSGKLKVRIEINRVDEGNFRGITVQSDIESNKSCMKKK